MHEDRIAAVSRITCSHMPPGLAAEHADGPGSLALRPTVPATLA